MSNENLQESSPDLRQAVASATRYLERQSQQDPEDGPDLERIDPTEWQNVCESFLLEHRFVQDMLELMQERLERERVPQSPAMVHIQRALRAEARVSELERVENTLLNGIDSLVEAMKNDRR